MIYGDADPLAVLFTDTIFSLEENDDSCRFCIKLPFVDKKDIDLLQKGDELFVTVGNQYRSFVLPPKQKGKAVTGAEYADGKLQIVLGQ